MMLFAESDAAMRICLMLWFLFPGCAFCQSCNGHYSVNEICYQDYGSTLNLFTNVTSLAACTIWCSNDVSCASVLFDATNESCTTNSGFIGEMSFGCNLKYAEFLKSNCKSLSNLGSACAAIEDCFDDGSTCLNGLCGCDLGYSHDPTNQACVEHCDGGYGTTFNMFEGMLLAGYNSDTIDGADPDSCKAACVSSTGFLCVTAELSNSGSCYLSTETARTKPESLKESSDYTYFQRNCK